MQLGEKVGIAQSPDQAIIEVVPNPVVGRFYVARFIAPEFTSLCPVTGQPDFARLWIDYIPAGDLIESKSLKLFLGSFRNHGAFHEACTMKVAERLFTAAQPHWMRVMGFWFPRGGIPIDVFWQSGPPPEAVLVPPIPQLDYTGR